MPNIVTRLTSDLRGFSSGFATADRTVDRFKSRTERVFSGLASRMAVAFGVAGGGGLLAKSLQQSFKIEKFTDQWDQYLGSAKAAKDHMKSMLDLSAKTPELFENINEASRLLYIFTEGKDFGEEAIKRVGDAAALSGREIQEVTFWYARMYAMIKANRPTGEETRRLTEMGIMSPNFRNTLEGMQSAGSSPEQLIAALNKEFSKFDGSMERISKIGVGLWSTFKDNILLTLKGVGDAFSDLAKNEMSWMIKKLQDLREGGTLDQWAERVKNNLQGVMDRARAFLAALEANDGAAAGSSIKAFGNILLTIFKTGGMILANQLIEKAPSIGRLISQGMKGMIAPGDIYKGDAQLEKLYSARSSKFNETPKGDRFGLTRSGEQRADLLYIDRRIEDRKAQLKAEWVKEQIGGLQYANPASELAKAIALFDSTLAEYIKALPSETPDEEPPGNRTPLFGGAPLEEENKPLNALKQQYTTADSMAKIGAKVGGQSFNLESIMAKQTYLQEQIAENTRTMAEKETATFEVVN